MSTPKPPGKPAAKGASPKPFLGDDDLSELDAWVETFDALHMGDEGGAQEQPGSDPTDLVNLEGGPQDSFGGLELGDAIDPNTLDGPIDEPYAARGQDPESDQDSDGGLGDPRGSSARVVESYAPDPNEAAFSGIKGAAAESPPLPRFQPSGPLPRLHGDDDDLAVHAFG